MKQDDDTINQIISVLEKDEIKSGLTLAAEGLSLGNPVVGIVTQAFFDIVTIADRIKVQRILKGLASGLNQETFTYELLSYVRESDEHASYVANMIRKAMLADSEIVCVLMGRIMADHIASREKYDKFDVIIIHAIGAATDNDMKCFYKMMRLVDKEELPNDDEYADCIEWGLANRVFKREDGERAKGEKIEFYDYVAPKEAAYKLFNYLEEIKQLI